MVSVLFGDSLSHSYNITFSCNIVLIKFHDLYMLLIQSYIICLDNFLDHGSNNRLSAKRVYTHPFTGSSAIPLGTLDCGSVNRVRRWPLSRSSTEMVSGVASLQYSLLVNQSIARPSIGCSIWKYLVSMAQSPIDLLLYMVCAWATLM